VLLDELDLQVAQEAEGVRDRSFLIGPTVHELVRAVPARGEERTGAERPGPVFSSLLEIVHQIGVLKQRIFLEHYSSSSYIA
jgi:hypothetical protein